MKIQKMTEKGGHSEVAIPPEIIKALEQSGRILVLCHHNPDGDAIGSSSALIRMVSGQGKQVRLFLAGDWSKHLDFFLDGVAIDPEPKSSDYDLVMILDCHGFDRLGPEGPELAEELKELPLVVIDHHLLAEDEKTDALWLYNPEASSTGELICLLARAMNWKPSFEAVQGLLLAIASDTGFFGQNNTTSEALHASADLLDLGGDLEDIKRRIKQDQPLRRYKLMGHVLLSLKLHFQGRLATMNVTPAMLEAAGAEMADTENFVELGRDLAGVELSALIKDSGKGPGSVRVSLRSREGVDARALALSFGGGGHLIASAYNDQAAGSADEALEHLLARAEKYLSNV